MSLRVNVNVFTTPKNLQRHPLSSNSCGLRQILRRICRILKEWRLFTQRGPENILLQTAAAQSIKNHKIKRFLLLQGPLKLNTAEGLSLLLQDLKLHRAWKHNRVGSLSDLKGCFVDGVLEKKLFNNLLNNNSWGTCEHRSSFRTSALISSVVHSLTGGLVSFILLVLAQCSVGLTDVPYWWLLCRIR